MLTPENAISRVGAPVSAPYFILATGLGNGKRICEAVRVAVC
jgi:hypothetical protein